MKINRIIYAIIFIIAGLTLIGCRSKKITKTQIDSVVKEVYQVKDSINTKTIFEYETIYDTTRKEYTTHIKRIITTESQNKTLQAKKDTKVSKDTKEVVKEPIYDNNKILVIAIILLLLYLLFKK